jgi:hypothetical protein
LAAEVRQRATPPARFVRKSLVSPHNDVTLPALKFMGQRKPIDDAPPQA